jgi:hypothetical protein
MCSFKFTSILNGKKAFQFSIFCKKKKTKGLEQIRNWKYKAALSSPPQLPKSATDDPVGADILKNIGDMSNHILANEASKNLAR